MIKLFASYSVRFVPCQTIKIKLTQVWVIPKISESSVAAGGSFFILDISIIYAIITIQN